jgi:hypothetical protein
MMYSFIVYLCGVVDVNMFSINLSQTWDDQLRTILQVDLGTEGVALSLVCIEFI